MSTCGFVSPVAGYLGYAPRFKEIRCVEPLADLEE